MCVCVCVLLKMTDKDLVFSFLFSFSAFRNTGETMSLKITEVVESTQTTQLRHLAHHRKKKTNENLNTKPLSVIFNKT